ncbi:MAG: PHP domain-containing protein [Spirochaetes bacterium GWD1_27_9]|nr:MAG: PHP domain-containing protein [Spirochaetes bacterium GWB1_27_13]OHD33649.1 MAG: PHP domain-containing protein [Spirochaetes bacterium GWD1_27_9]
MIDFHTHTLFSDGILSPSEHVRRALVAGYKVIGLTDHVDFSNIEFVFNSINQFTKEMENCGWDIKIIPGVEITHVPPSKIEKIVQKARDLKIPLIIVHGESPVEPVEKGTNRAAIDSLVDILAHPGLILEEDVKKASENGVSLEITARKGHSITNGYLAKLAKKYNPKLVLDSDSHSHEDFLKPEFKKTVLIGAGLDKDQIDALENNMIELAKRVGG